jgi:hypothetical protein
METLADSEAMRLIGKYTDYDLDFINLFKEFPEEKTAGYAYFRIQEDENDSEVSAVFSQMCISKENFSKAIMQLMSFDNRWHEAVERALINYLFYNNDKLDDFENKLNKLKCHLKKDTAIKQ